jgi:hypothetical protein
MLTSPIPVWWADDVSTGAPPGRVLQVLLYIWPILVWALWLVGTAWTWRTERLQTLPGFVAGEGVSGGPAWCPQCGYSLTGLHEVRCPECGWSSTVDDIVARSLSRISAVP